MTNKYFVEQYKDISWSYKKNLMINTVTKTLVDNS